MAAIKFVVILVRLLFRKFSYPLSSKQGLALEIRLRAGGTCLSLVLEIPLLSPFVVAAVWIFLRWPAS